MFRVLNGNVAQICHARHWRTEREQTRYDSHGLSLHNGLHGQVKAVKTCDPLTSVQKRANDLIVSGSVGTGDAFISQIL